MEPFIGEITMFGGNFAPRGWAFCDGQLLAISSNEALFSLLGTIYGGDGRTTFGLPELRGRIPLHQGTGPGLSQRRIGLRSGSEGVTLTPSQLPSHTHTVSASGFAGDSNSPFGNFRAQSDNVRAFRTDSPPNATLNNATVSNTGNGQSHTNLMPTQSVNFIIALFGTYPSRS